MTRREWSQSFRFCFVCGWFGTPSTTWLETHEIYGGPLRAFTVNEPCMWFRACNHCHAQLPSVPNSRLAAWQLSLKRTHDPGDFDLGRFIELSRKHDAFVTVDDINAAQPPAWAQPTEG